MLNIKANFCGSKPDQYKKCGWEQREVEMRNYQKVLTPQATFWGPSFLIYKPGYLTTGRRFARATIRRISLWHFDRGNPLEGTPFEDKCTVPIIAG
jgi:hypothetical protein